MPSCDRRESTGEGGTSLDSAVTGVEAYSVCERRCLDGGIDRIAGSRGVALSSEDNGAGAESGNVDSSRRDCDESAGAPEDELGSFDPVSEVLAVFPPDSASKSTMRFTRFFRGFALAAVRRGDGWRDEAGENVGLLEELAPPDAAGGPGTAIGTTPTGTTGGEEAFDTIRVELIWTDGGEVRFLFS